MCFSIDSPYLSCLASPRKHWVCFATPLGFNTVPTHHWLVWVVCVCERHQRREMDTLVFASSLCSRRKSNGGTGKGRRAHHCPSLMFLTGKTVSHCVKQVALWKKNKLHFPRPLSSIPELSTILKSPQFIMAILEMALLQDCSHAF